MIICCENCTFKPVGYYKSMNAFAVFSNPCLRVSAQQLVRILGCSTSKGEDVLQPRLIVTIIENFISSLLFYIIFYVADNSSRISVCSAPPIQSQHTALSFPQIQREVIKKPYRPSRVSLPVVNLPQGFLSSS